MRWARTAVVVVGLSAAVAGCSTVAGGESEGNVLRNLLLYGGTTMPAPAPSTADLDTNCPPVMVIPGGSVLRPGGGANQIALGELARECRAQPDGSIMVKIGAEGRALMGPGGRAGTFGVPVRFVVKRGDRVFATRARQASVTIPAGDTQGRFVVVEDGLVVPPNVGDYEIQVGLGGAGAVERPARRRRG